MSNLILAYEFVYRDLQARHTDWSDQRLLKSVLTYSVFPFCVGMAGLVLLLAVTRLLRSQSNEVRRSRRGQMLGRRRETTGGVLIDYGEDCLGPNATWRGSYRWTQADSE